jgi:predicted amidohydrolase YtcJ
MSLLISGGEFSVRIDGGRVVEAGRGLEPKVGDEVLDARDGTVIPGLHDHHIHVHALAAARNSVRLDGADRSTFAGRLRRAIPRPDGWVRAVGYHESMAGLLDAHGLDAIVADRPVRMQHRSGALWILNGVALRAVDAEHAAHPGIERDAGGRPTGRLWRADEWLRTVLAPDTPDLAGVGAELAARGVTGVTDADPQRPPGSLERLRQMPQRVHVMGPADLRFTNDERLTLGPIKVILDDPCLPSIEDLAAMVGAAHETKRAVAVHCVTRAQLLLTLAALDDAGPTRGDRIEHGAVIPDDVVADVRRLGLVVVTQPNFVAERGDTYLADVDPDDLPHLYRSQSLLDAGIATAAGTDAPFGGADPWAAMRAAVERRAPSGAVLGAGERLSPRNALGLFLGRPDAPAVERALQAGGPADLCVLRAPLSSALSDLTSDLVAATVIGGHVVYQG